MATVTKDIQEESEKITKVKRIIKKRTENLEKKTFSLLLCQKVLHGRSCPSLIQKIQSASEQYFQVLGLLNMPSSGLV